jgi:hypothetical protein
MKIGLKPFLDAFKAGGLEDQLFPLIMEAKNAGATEKEVVAALLQMREQAGLADAENTLDNVVCDIMDCVVGWCGASNYIFGENFNPDEFWGATSLEPSD